jgi:hypothetical protein
MVVNGRAQPYRADAPATLTFRADVNGVAAIIFFNGKPLGTVAANAPAKTAVRFDIPSDRLAKLNRVTVRTGGSVRLHDIKLEYKKQSIYDPRSTFVPHDFDKATSASSRPEDALYFCLP